MILLTAKGSEYDKVIGWTPGADDYLPKPFGMMELVSRIKAGAPPHRGARQEEYRVGSSYVCPAPGISSGPETRKVIWL